MAVVVAGLHERHRWQGPAGDPGLEVVVATEVALGEVGGVVGVVLERVAEDAY